MTEQGNIKIIRPNEGFQEKFIRSNVDVVFGGGVLNPQPLDAKILTPDGFILMRDVKRGDIICNPFGGTQTVNFVLDKGKQPCVEFVLADGRTVQSALSHHWKVLDSDGEIFEMEAQDIVRAMDDGLECYLPYTYPGECSEIISSYRFIGKKEVRCINVSGNEHIYITDDYVITCNCGKAQPLESHVLTPNGFVRMGDLKVGDIISGSDGGTQEVLHIFERGELDTYRITFDDGTQVECCPEHLWTVWDSNNAQYKTIEAQYINEDKERYKLGLHKALSLSSSFTTLLSEADKIRSLGYKVTSDNEDNIVSVSAGWKRFSSIESIGKKQMRCIVVSNEDHLYITDGFNLTHNSFAAILSVAEPSLDGNFRACFTRRTFGELKTGGGLVDDFSTAYGSYATIKKSENPRVTFPSGAFVEMRQINDESIRKITEQWKGSQYDLIYMDELTSYAFSTFKYLLTRNRGKGKWTGKFRGTTNPEKDCWVRKFIDWYVGADGQIRPERDGVVRYFYINGNTVDDIEWGDTKEDVYFKCKNDIDSKLRGLGEGFTYKNLIKSFTFYLGRMSENKPSIGNNMDYAGSVAAVGGAQAKQLIEGNWNVSSIDQSDIPIPTHIAKEVVINDPQCNGNKYITVDLADTGTDNTIILVWNGFHIYDIRILNTSTPRENAELISETAKIHNIPDNHIIYDAIRGTYINDYIPDAVQYVSYRQPMGLYRRGAADLKTECYLRLVEAIKNHQLSMSSYVANHLYEHQRIKNKFPVALEFVDECAAVRFRFLPSGKRKLWGKKEMNSLLGNNRSMDLLDPCAMRMLPVLEYVYGEELEKTMVDTNAMNDDDVCISTQDTDIYDESTWA